MPINIDEQNLTRLTYKWFVLGVLCVLTLTSQLDRQLTSVLVAPLKARFQITDSQFGMLHGFAFAVAYSLCAIPLGLLVDRTNRRNIVLLAVLLWSALTLATAFAFDFAQLVVLRLGVGIGEAVLGPAAYSLIASYFPPEQRGRATGIYYMALSTGAGLSLIAGGLLLRGLPSSGLVLVGQHFAPWQVVFLCAGLPGIFAASLVLFVREPQRHAPTTTVRPSLSRTSRYLWHRRSHLGRILAASAILAMIGYGAAAWLPTFFERRFSIAPGQSGPLIGWMFIGGSVIGPLLSGWLGDRWVRRHGKTARLRLLEIAFLIMVPATIWPILPLPWMCFALCSAMVLAISMIQSMVPLVLQESVAEDMHGQIVALLYLVLGLVGFGLGPVAIALVTDYVFRSEALLHWSLVVVALPSSLVGLWLARTLARAPYGDDRA